MRAFDAGARLTSPIPGLMAVVGESMESMSSRTACRKMNIKSARNAGRCEVACRCEVVSPRVRCGEALRVVVVLDLSVPSLRKGHANLVFVVPMLLHDLCRLSCSACRSSVFGFGRCGTASLKRAPQSVSCWPLQGGA